jgi:hypothetical protein
MMLLFLNVEVCEHIVALVFRARENSEGESFGLDKRTYTYLLLFGEQKFTMLKIFDFFRLSSKKGSTGINTVNLQQLVIDDCKWIIFN